MSAGASTHLPSSLTPRATSRDVPPSFEARRAASRRIRRRSGVSSASCRCACATGPGSEGLEVPLDSGTGDDADGADEAVREAQQRGREEERQVRPPVAPGARRAERPTT